MEYRNLTTEEFEGLRSRILYEDNHLLIVNKLPGEITQGDKTGDETLADKYKAFIAQRDSKPGKVFMGIPHRLDRPVSGLTILAKTSKALERMSELFRGSDIHKTYYALVCKEPERKTAILEDYLTRNEKMNKTFVSKKKINPDNKAENPDKNTKYAKLSYSMIGRTDRYFLLEVRLFTGRHHQIRCQLANIGCTIKGDLKYGAPRSNPDGSICLHSRNINFIHPIKKTEIDITAPVPQTWKGVDIQ